MYRYTLSDKSGSFYVRPTGRKGKLGLFARACNAVLGWAEHARQRRQLGELDDRLLSDIGISRVEVEAEISRPFWRTEV